MSEPISQRPGTSTDAYVELLFTLFLVAFSLVFVWQSTYIPDPPRNIAVGPRTFPTIVSWMMLVVSAVLAVRQARVFASGRRQQEGNDAPLVAMEEDDDNAIADWPAVWVMLGSLIALFALLEPLGFVASLTLFLFGLPTFFGREHWLRNLIVATSFSLFFYYMFTQVLMVPLPNGIFAWLF